MALFLLVLVALCCYRMKISSFHQDFLSVTTTTAIKGIFAILILYSHNKGYLSLGQGLPDRLFIYTMKYLKQLIVVVYFFYSGYGIMESVKNKQGYIHGFFKKRFLKTLFHFDLAVFLFLILQFILGNRFETADYLGCWIGWESIGNSSWFIFVILSLYLITYLSFVSWERLSSSKWFPAITISILSAGLWLFLRHIKQDYWWYDTLAAFPAGICFSLLRNGSKPVGPIGHRLLLTIATVVLFILWRHFHGIDIYGICAILFSFAVIAISMWVKLDNPALRWLGKHCFSIYILQRIPMIVFSHFGLQDNKYLFSILVIVTALLLAWGFTYLTDKLDNKLFARQ